MPAPYFNTAILLGVMICSVWIWGGGCDFSRVEEDAAIPIKAILADLSSADTQPKAEEAIDRLLKKTKAGVLALTEDEFVLVGEARSDLAEELMAFNNRTLTQTTSIIGVYKKLASNWPSNPVDQDEASVELDEALALLHLLANDAQADPEDPYSSLMLAISTPGPAIPAEFPVFSPDHVLSPVQAFLFSAWLLEFDPAIDVLSSRGKQNVDDCPRCQQNKKGPKRYLICHKRRKTLCLPRPAAQKHLKNHGDTCGPCHDQGGGS